MTTTTFQDIAIGEAFYDQPSLLNGSADLRRRRVPLRSYGETVSNAVDARGAGWFYHSACPVTRAPTEEP